MGLACGLDLQHVIETEGFHQARPPVMFLQSWGATGASRGAKLQGGRERQDRMAAALGKRSRTQTKRARAGGRRNWG